MKKISKEEKEKMTFAYGRSSLAVSTVDSLDVGDDLLITDEELVGVNVHYIYIAMLRKGKKIQQKKVKGEGYVFTRLS